MAKLPVGQLRHVPNAGFGGQPLMLGTPDQILRMAEDRYKNKDMVQLVLSVGNYVRDKGKRKQQMSCSHGRLCR